MNAATRKAYEEAGIVFLTCEKRSITTYEGCGLTVTAGRLIEIRL
ncbi:hypothetical protein [Brevibacillus humidisoli]|nr:hypothetical protein [Brevibacillus humidisoli]